MCTGCPASMRNLTKRRLAPATDTESPFASHTRGCWAAAVLSMPWRIPTGPVKSFPNGTCAAAPEVEDTGSGHLERWQAMAGGETAIVWDAQDRKSVV